jgi:hypothetical protein
MPSRERIRPPSERWSYGTETLPEYPANMAHAMTDTTGWRTCRDERYGFSFRYPPDWVSTTGEGTCVQLQKGTAALPHGIPEVDVNIRVAARQGDFPGTYLQETPVGGGTGGIGRGVQYTERSERTVGGLRAVRARFATVGDVPNWGVEYVVNKGDLVLDIYISQPLPEIEEEFESVLSTLQW